jgi:hypothetical protein
MIKSSTKRGMEVEMTPITIKVLHYTPKTKLFGNLGLRPDPAASQDANPGEDKLQVRCECAAG